jgi:hypothetical protein
MIARKAHLTTSAKAFPTVTGRVESRESTRAVVSQNSTDDVHGRSSPEWDLKQSATIGA